MQLKDLVTSQIREFSSLRENLSSLNVSVSNLSMCLQEHKQQTAAELAQLQTALNITQFSMETITSQLNTPTATTTQISADQNELRASISDTECVNIEHSLQLLQDNLTYQLDYIRQSVDMLYCGGGGWKRAVYLDMTDPCATCPSGWQLTGYSKRTCGRANTSIEWNSCDSVMFPVNGPEYSRVCGRVKAYKKGSPVAFWSYDTGRISSINGAYVDGVSLTHNSNQQHIWTFAAGMPAGSSVFNGICPCDTNHTIRVPPFVGEDYFCESGVNEQSYGNIRGPLWDGENCLSSSTCCSLHTPYFVKQLPTPTTDDIEARICLSYPQYQDIAVELIDLYVQ